MSFNKTILFAYRYYKSLNFFVKFFVLYILFFGFLYSTSVVRGYISRICKNYERPQAIVNNSSSEGVWPYQKNYLKVVAESPLKKQSTKKVKNKLNEQKLSQTEAKKPEQKSFNKNKFIENAFNLFSIKSSRNESFVIFTFNKNQTRSE
jgi:hypothetical protein